MDFQTVALDAINFCADYDEMISIGGGEPTLHPRFFDILKKCMDTFDYVWLATNGSQTAAMYRLARIMDEEDYPEDVDPEDEMAYDMAMGKSIFPKRKGHLAVDLSQDYFHDPIDQKIIDLWTRRAKKINNGIDRGFTGFAIRDVTRSVDGVSAVGRAAHTGSGWGKHCVCEDRVIMTSGKIRLCGCLRAPIIGDVWHGINSHWKEALQNDEKFLDVPCYKNLKGRRNKAI